MNKDIKAPCSASEYVVTKADLPLSCPTREMAVWNAHPRVYLPIDKTGKETCPYCGSKDVIKFGFYRYKDDVKQRYYCNSCEGITIKPARRKPKRRRRYD